MGVCGFCCKLNLDVGLLKKFFSFFRMTAHIKIICHLRCVQSIHGIVYCSLCFGEIWVTQMTNPIVSRRCTGGQ